ncbi:MAG TPA: proton-conducting transporter membrane subunit [Prolixibacteraceae bacterium]
MFLILQTATTIYAYFHLNEEDSGYFKFDAIGVLFMCVLTLLSFTTIYHSYIYLRHRKDSSRIQSIYFAALVMLIVAMTCAYLVAHLGLLWVFIELTTLSVAVLIYHERTPLALEATWKYVFVCSIGITITFIGIILLSFGLSETETIDFSFKALQVQLLHVNPSWLKLSFLFMIIGFCTKMGLFPMHTAAIDAHTVAPPPISAFISTTLMNVGFIAIFRTYSLFAHTPILSWMNQVLLWCGLISIVVSAAYLLKVKHLKRMSAYSSIEHMGLAAIGLASGGIGYFAAIFHMVLHSFVKASVFYQIDQFHRNFGTYIISETGNYFNRNRPGAMVFLLVLIGIIAMPPSGLFVTEFWIFKALFTSSHFYILILALTFLSVTIFALAKNFLYILFNQTKDLLPAEEKPVPSETYSQYFLLALIFYFGINPPDQMIQLIQEAVKNLP